MARSHVNVLVVEDERHLADSHAEWLDAEYAVRTAYTGESAVAALDDAPPDVLVLDRHLPDLSGKAVLDAVEERGIDCQVALLSAVEPDLDVLELRYDLYVEKPVTDAETLRSAVETLRRRHEYDVLMRRYFDLASERGMLEARKSPGELADSEAHRELLSELDALSGEVETAMTQLDNDDFRADFHDRCETWLAPSESRGSGGGAADVDVGATRTPGTEAPSGDPEPPSTEASGTDTVGRRTEAERE